MRTIPRREAKLVLVWERLRYRDRFPEPGADGQPSEPA